MSAEKLNARIDIPVEELEDRINCRLNGELPSYKTVVSPRELVQVRMAGVIHQSLLRNIVQNIPLRGSDRLPYKGLDIRLAPIKPGILRIGQTFVLRDKIISLMTQMPQKIFDGFCLEGISTAPPLELYGTDKKGRRAIALYLPPIVEYHGSRPTLLDGIHRSYLCKGAGTQVNAVHIFNVTTDLPFNPINWQDCTLREEKPPREGRYFGLRTELFRDLTYVGIDG
ncbi:MAG: hypothetical protein KKD18_03225 [Nanoarchaeota archaeon]|nr:hypothetical protein [Nanoarchaeota archaeon]MBU0977401.1 hypothetical protein [Nanoarchaeota archaeon]